MQRNKEWLYYKGGELQWKINGARENVARSIMTDRMQQSVSIHEEISDICKKGEKN